ncbi:MAG: hypothetical protein PHQ05_07495 [Sterolibacterium sp.]|nr:hypothetical protein [Sterolibacterium sp.]
MTHRALLLLISISCLPLPALAADSVVRGATSCGEWVAQRKKSDNLALSNASWLVGFLSGLSVGSGRNFLGSQDNASIFTWMDKYCGEHPLRDTASGAKDLMNELQQKRTGK